MNLIKKYRKTIVLLVLLLVLVGCKVVTDPETGKVMEKYIISLGDGFPWGKEGYGWFDIFIVYPIAQMFNIVAKYTGAFVSLVVVTLFVNAVKLGLTIKQTIQQQKMQALQPEIARIEEKYRGRDDQQAKMQKATEIQKIYQKHEINVMGSFLPLLIQLPLILAMFQSVQRADMIINGTILGNPFSGTPKQGFMEMNYVYITIFIVMIITNAISMLLPQYLQKRNKSKRYDQQKGPNMQGMMLFSLGMIVFLAFNWNIGMSIYWSISALIQFAQTMYVQTKYVTTK